MMDVVPLFKALADESRIRIIALIADRGLSVEEIAAATGLTPPTVSHHLSRLRDAGLVDATHEQYYTIYRFRQQPLLDALQAIATQPARPDLADDLARYDQKVLGDYLVDGKLKTIPAQRKKRDVILRYLAQQFDADRRYSEREVNQLLVAFHDDVVTLRRELIMAGLMERQSGVYWRPTGDAATSKTLPNTL
jgi:biotin operon repressor